MEKKDREVFIQYKKTNGINMVFYKNYNPESLPDEILDKGIVVKENNIPKLSNLAPGKEAVLAYDEETQKLYYEIFDSEESEDKKQEYMKTKHELIQMLQEAEEKIQQIYNKLEELV